MLRKLNLSRLWRCLGGNCLCLHSIALLRLIPLKKIIQIKIPLCYQKLGKQRGLALPHFSNTPARQENWFTLQILSRAWIVTFEVLQTQRRFSPRTTLRSKQSTWLSAKNWEMDYAYKRLEYHYPPAEHCICRKIGGTYLVDLRGLHKEVDRVIFYKLI